MSPEAEIRHLADAAVRGTFVVFLLLYLFIYFCKLFPLVSDRFSMQEERDSTQTK